VIHVYSREFCYPASIILNVVLAGTVIALAMYKSVSPLSPSASRDNLKTTTNGMPPVASGPKRLPTPGAENGDWRNWIDALRAAGVPNKVIAGLALSDFENR
jgi:hypothetical protein